MGDTRVPNRLLILYRSNNRRAQRPVEEVSSAMAGLRRLLPAGMHKERPITRGWTKWSIRPKSGGSQRTPALGRGLLQESGVPQSERGLVIRQSPPPD
jgi:hypothetical protein